MADRAEKLLNIPAKNLWIGTFHGICVRILRREAERWGFRRDFTIYDRDDQNAIVKKALKEMGLGNGPPAPGAVIKTISDAKSGGISPDEFAEFNLSPEAPLLEKLYRRYNELMREAGAFDFDDLLLVPVNMFRQDRESLEKWKNRFSYILVDEYQDTNHVQYLLMKLLNGDSGNITVVGDDDQSIYGWRGADIQNILGFEKDLKNVKTVRLERNYRSTGIILKAANAVVANNKMRMSKQLRTDEPDGAKVRVAECYNEKDEARIVLDAVASDREKNGLKLRDCVVLYRTNSQSRLFEEVLIRRGIPYVIVGGTRFYERKEIKDMLAYLRLIANPGDMVSFERAAAAPRRGIGAKTIETVERFAEQNHVSIIDALTRADEYLSAGMANKVKSFYGILKPVIDMRSKKAGLDELALEVVKKTGYEQYLKDNYPDNAEDRIDNVNELITAMGDFLNETDEDDLSSFLAEVSLVADVDRWDDSSDALTLMTMHSAKGLEFKSVYIAGVEDMLFPHPMSYETDAMLEEERRLFYVGITRAEKLLHISYALDRFRYGSFSGGASIFIDELPPGIVDFEAQQREHALPYNPKGKPDGVKSPQKTFEFEDYSQEAPEFEDSGFYRAGANVRHPKFGRGKITAVSGSGENLILTIQFGTQTKKILPKYAKLAPA